MTGSGKSCLAAAALDSKQLVIEKFKVSMASYPNHNTGIPHFTNTLFTNFRCNKMC
jgi:hypothetical protein